MFCICNFISWWLFTGAIRTTCVLDLETKPHYWLTVCAQDQAVVPLYSCVEVRLVLVYCSVLHCIVLCFFILSAFLRLRGVRVFHLNNFPCTFIHSTSTHKHTCLLAAHLYGITSICEKRESITPLCASAYTLTNKQKQKKHSHFIAETFPISNILNYIPFNYSVIKWFLVAAAAAVFFAHSFALANKHRTKKQ